MKKKLKNNDGMSIVIAMVIFLVSAIISLAIVGISLNNAQQVGRQFEEQQANLAISSAASFFQTLFDGVSAGCNNDGTGWGEWEFDYGESKLGEDEYTGFREAFEGAFFANGGSLKNGELTWTIKGLEVDSKKPLDVIAKIKLDNNNLVVTLAKLPNSGGSSGNTNYKYFQVLNFKGGEFTDSNYYKEYTWSYVSLER